MLTPRTRTFIPGLIASLAILSGGAIAWAQQARQLHEYFTPPDNLESVRRGGLADDGANQAPRVKTRQPGEAPPLTLGTRRDEPVHGEKGPVSSLPMKNPQGGLDPQSATNRLDDDTDRVDELNYFSSFDPSVIPYKRGVSQNRVIRSGSDWAFVVAPGSYRRVRVEQGGARANEDVFWGSFLLRADAGRRNPIPSVAPDQRILEAHTEPDVSMRIERDEADNHYVTFEQTGLVRLNLKIAAPRYYFDGDFTDSVTWSQLRASSGQLDTPAELTARAKDVVRQLGMSTAASPRSVLMRLVKHFRDFEGKPFPESRRGEDIYTSIALEKIGVCRHRSFAFAITAAALGIPARYVYNEAHAFVEVYWPSQGWRRIDLGGAAEDVLMRADAEQARVHDGGVDDELPTPPAYQRELERLAEKEAERNADMGTGRAAATGDGDNGGFEDDPGPMNRLPEDDEAEAGADAKSDPIDPAATQDNAEPAPVDERPGTFIQVTEVTPDELRRGETFSIQGRLTDLEGNPLPDQPIDIAIVSPNERGGAKGRVLKEARTGMDGRFGAEVVLPKDLPIGRWSLRAFYEGGESYKPARSR